MAEVLKDFFYLINGDKHTVFVGPKGGILVETANGTRGRPSTSARFCDSTGAELSLSELKQKVTPGASVPAGPKLVEGIFVLIGDEKRELSVGSKGGRFYRTRNNNLGRVSALRREVTYVDAEGNTVDKNDPRLPPLPAKRAKPAATAAEDVEDMPPKRTPVADIFVLVKGEQRELFQGPKGGWYYQTTTQRPLRSLRNPQFVNAAGEPVADPRPAKQAQAEKPKQPTTTPLEGTFILMGGEARELATGARGGLYFKTKNDTWRLVSSLKHPAEFIDAEGLPVARPETAQDGSEINSPTKSAE